MNHRFDPSLLSGYLDGELSPAEVALVEQVLAAHPEQHAELESLRRVRDALAQWPTVEPTADPVAAVRQRIEQQRAAGVRQSGRLPRHWVAMLAMAASLLMGLGLLAYRVETRQLTLAPPDAASGPYPATEATAPLAEDGSAATADRRSSPPAAADTQALSPPAVSTGIAPESRGARQQALQYSPPARSARSELDENEAAPAAAGPPAATERAATAADAYGRALFRDPQQPAADASSPVRPKPFRQRGQAAAEPVAKAMPESASEALSAPAASPDPGSPAATPDAASPDAASPDAASPDAALPDLKRSRSGADASMAAEPQAQNPQALGTALAEPSAAAASTMEAFDASDLARPRARPSSDPDAADAPRADAESAQRGAGYFWYFDTAGAMPLQPQRRAGRAGKPDAPLPAELLSRSPSEATSPPPQLLRGRVPAERWDEAQRRLQQQLERYGLQNLRSNVRLGDAVSPPAAAESQPSIRIAVDASPETVRALQIALEQQLRSLGGTLTVVAAGEMPRGGMGGAESSQSIVKPLVRRFADVPEADELQRGPPPLVIELSAGSTQ